MEIWLPIVGTDYFISNIGRIKNKNGRISEGSIHKGHGYAQTKISKNNNYTPVNIHRLVAEAFISNPENKPFVNHINGIKTDNRADNLEWVSPKENANRKVFPNPGRSRSRKVVQKTLDGNVIQIWDSANHAGITLNINRRNITACCRGNQNIAGKWTWIYYDDYIESDPNEEWKGLEIDSEKFKVSSLGRIQLLNGMITQGSLSGRYFRVGRRHLHFQVHRLVALAFCLKKQGKNYVNHIDGNPTNNKASNLEWCTQKENMQHAVSYKLWNGYKRTVKQIFPDGSTQEFLSLKEAERATGIKSQNIGAVCKTIRSHAGGYHWEYIDSVIHNKS